EADAPLMKIDVPKRGEIPVLVEVPHAGIRVPDLVREQLNMTPESLLRDADRYVEKLYEGVPRRGATLLVAMLSRYVVDLNREEEDVERETVPDHPAPRASRPRGVVWRLTTDGQPALSRPLTYAEFKLRIEKYYTPYHAALSSHLDRIRKRFGHAVLVA